MSLLTKNQNYLPFQNFMYSGEKFLTNVTIKKKYNKIINEISNFNKNSINEIKKINNQYKQTCSFLTRNIPHLGHEKIIETLLEKFDHIVITPLVGPKKKW